MANPKQTNRAPITDSPWFWGYVFATAALFGLMLIGPKFAARNLQVQRQYEGRQRALQNRADEEPTTSMSSIAGASNRLTALYWIVGTLLAIAWIGFWWVHLRRDSMMKRRTLVGEGADPSGDRQE